MIVMNASWASCCLCLVKLPFTSTTQKMVVIGLWQKHHHVVDKQQNSYTRAKGALFRQDEAGWCLSWQTYWQLHHDEIHLFKLSAMYWVTLPHQSSTWEENNIQTCQIFAFKTPNLFNFPSKILQTVGKCSINTAKSKYQVLQTLFNQAMTELKIKLHKHIGFPITIP